MATSGSVVLDRYRLEREIGAGGVGVVWRATDQMLDLTVALKRVSFAGLGTAARELTMERTLREARLAAKLRSSPHVVALYDVRIADPDIWLVLEYLPSQSLSAVLAETGRLPPGEMARIGADVAGALTAAHHLGIQHRDVTPGNVLIGADGTVKLTDFGIAHGDTDPRITQVGLVTGTVAYMAPETARGEDTTSAADIFSLAATMYAALEGNPPCGYPQSPQKLVNTLAIAGIPAPLHAGPLAPLLHRALQTDPAARPTAGTFAAELRELATQLSPNTLTVIQRNTAEHSSPEGAPAPTPPMTSETTDRNAAPARRAGHRAAIPLAVGLVLGLLALVAVFVYQPSTSGTPSAAQSPSSASGPTSASGAAPSDAPPPDGPRFGANLKDVDSCALLDAGTLRRFGDPEIARGKYLEGCHALISDRADNETYVGVSFSPPEVERPTFDGIAEERGEITVFRQEAPVDRADPECENNVVLADNSVLHVEAYPDEIDQRRYAALCAVTNSATDTAVARVRNGIPRSDAVTSRFDLSSRDACALMDKRTLAGVPNLAYRSTASGFADWMCEWGADADGAPYVYLEFKLLEEYDLDTYGDPTTVAGRRAFQRQEDSAYTDEQCVLRLEYQKPGPEGGPSEVLEIGVSTTQSGTQRCAEAREVATNALRTLSP